jgi:hypothetical protein
LWICFALLLGSLVLFSMKLALLLSTKPEEAPAPAV